MGTKSTTMTPRSDVYERVTASIVTVLEAGTRPWLKPWSAPQQTPFPLPLRANGTPYRGINVLLLWGAAFEHGYDVPRWMTYKQAAAAGGQVRKGEHGATVVFANSFTTTTTPGKTSSARSPSSRATPCSTSPRSTACRRAANNQPAPNP